MLYEAPVERYLFLLFRSRYSRRGIEIFTRDRNRPENILIS